ncbi:MAG: aspartate aminotransferase family protein [Pirellulales bacterium]|nr:aspartate aminotransferase family protein [Pirellulales bacterium]
MTNLPPAANNELDRDQRHLIHALHSRAAQATAHVWVEGRGAVIVDHTGQEFLDGLAGLWNVVVGHGRRELANAAAEQMTRLAYASAYTGSSNRPAIALGEQLGAWCYPGIQKFFFTCGGAESNESAFKTARYYWKTQGKPGKYKIVSRMWAYHGVTMAAMSATGMPPYWTMFEPRVPGFLHIASPYPYRFAAKAQDPRTPGQQAADLLEELILAEGPDTVAAFIGEPVQGAGGVIPAPDDYWPRIRAICDKYDVLLITDEIITGFGRLGQRFGLMRLGIEPDIVTFAKAITSGYFPLGGIGVNRAIAEAIDNAGEPSKWMHAFTYSGHPVGCAVALANLEIIEREGLIERAGQLGRRLLAGLQTLTTHPHVGDVRGEGLMCAVEIVQDKATKAEFPAAEQMGPRVHAETQKRGLFTRLRGDVYNLAPCFVTTDEQIDRMVSILGESIEAVLGR